jgi:hypothetical protein
MTATIHSERHDADLYLGKHTATELRSGTATYAEVRPALVKAGVLPTIPQQWGHGHDFPQGAWDMLGNGPDDSVFPGFGGCGDCAWADPAHDEMEAAKNAGRPVPLFTGLVVVEQYAEYEGWVPGVPAGRLNSLKAFLEANDNGSNMQDVIAGRQSKGLRDAHGDVYKIGKAVAIEPGNLQHLWEAAWLFENVDIGIEVTEAQQEQFNERAQPTWDYVAGSPVVGGHAVPVMGKLGLISWGEDVYYTAAFIAHQMDEGYAYIDNERYNAVTHETAEHWKDQDLEKYLTLVAQMKAAS